MVHVSHNSINNNLCGQTPTLFTYLAYLVGFVSPTCFGQGIALSSFRPEVAAYSRSTAFGTVELCP